jgi:hypothetical protein
VFDRAALAAAIAVAASDAETTALVAAARRPAVAGSPLWRVLERRTRAPAFGRNRDVAALGAQVGAVCERYFVGGWAIAAATAAAGDAAARMPAWPELVAAVSARARARFVAESAGDVAAHAPDRDALVASNAVPPAGDIVRGALAALIASLAELELAAGPTAETQLDAMLDVGARWLELPAAAGEPALDVPALHELVACLHDAGVAAWTWDAVATWQTGDALVLAKAIARGLGVGELVATLETTHVRLAEIVARLVEVAWRTEVEAVRRAALAAPPHRLADAIVELATHASVLAARRLAIAARALWDGEPGEDLGALVAELLGDPRDNPALWAAHAPAIRAALERS